MAAPQILKGFRDFLPQKMTVRKRIISLMTEVFESFGFEPIKSGGVECPPREDVLSVIYAKVTIPT